MMKATAVLLLALTVLALLTHNASAFAFSTPLALSFVASSARKQKASSGTLGSSAVKTGRSRKVVDDNDESSRQSLAKFNKMCQQVIEQERQDARSLLYPHVALREREFISV
jgi:hypothetical protein